MTSKPMTLSERGHAGNLHRYGHARLPLTPLLTHHTKSELARRTGYTRRQVQRWGNRGLTLNTADHVATRLGKHPADIWPEWWTA